MSNNKNTFRLNLPKGLSMTTINSNEKKEKDNHLLEPYKNSENLNLHSLLYDSESEDSVFEKKTINSLHKEEPTQKVLLEKQLINTNEREIQNLQSKCHCLENELLQKTEELINIKKVINSIILKIIEF